MISDVFFPYTLFSVMDRNVRIFIMHNLANRCFNISHLLHDSLKNVFFVCVLCIYIKYVTQSDFITVLALKGFSRVRPILANSLPQSLWLSRSTCLKYSAVVSILRSK